MYDFVAKRLKKIYASPMARDLGNVSMASIPSKKGQGSCMLNATKPFEKPYSTRVGQVEVGFRLVPTNLPELLSEEASRRSSDEHEVAGLRGKANCSRGEESLNSSQDLRRGDIAKYLLSKSEAFSDEEVFTIDGRTDKGLFFLVSEGAFPI